MAWNLADIGKKVVYLTIEMSPEEITERYICSFCEINSDDARKGILPEDFDNRIQAFHKVWDRMNMRVISAGRTVAEVRQVLDLFNEMPDVLFIDHIQRISTLGFPDIRNAITSYLNDLEGMAVSHNISVVVVSQLNRDATKRKDRMPTLEDLKESGSLEETGATVLLLHWPGKDALVTDPDKWKFNVIIGKQRNGPSGITIPLEYQAQYYRFRWPETTATQFSINGSEPPETRKDLV